MSKKQQYQKPALTIHGDVEQLTRNASCDDADTPQGVPDTAFTVNGECSM